MAWSYLKRISQNHAEPRVTSLTVHRLLITAVMLAAKLMDDKYYNNAYYAKIGGVAIGDLNCMELDMLRLLDYRVVVTGPQIQQLLLRLEVFQTPGRLNSVCAESAQLILQHLSFQSVCTSQRRQRAVLLHSELGSQLCQVQSCKVNLTRVQ
ncbi:TPA: hypothetical protein ACH3X1_012263 [Trebouxia sp. C0004]